jgi:xanthine/CO dehydrogenase XdhC/CoxF family maturation factor
MLRLKTLRPKFREGATPLVYLDNNATAPLLPEVLEGMLPYFSGQFGNPSALHFGGQRALSAMKQARASVSNLLGCLNTEIVFTGGGTEGDNLALLGMVAAGDHIVTSVIEHSAILRSCQHLEQLGCQVTRVGVNANGQVEPDEVRRTLRSNTKLISIMMANNETGVLQPVEEIDRIDDRQEFANRERFPDALDLHSGDMDQVMSLLDPPENSYIAIVTRGHRHDMRVLRWAVETKVFYLGMIGSERKVLTVFEQLENEGVSRETLDRVYAPMASK